MENLYKATFLKVLSEEPEMDDAAPDVSDSDAFKSQLDKGTSE